MRTVKGLRPILYVIIALLSLNIVLSAYTIFSTNRITSKEFVDKFDKAEERLQSAYDSLVAEKQRSAMEQIGENNDTQKEIIKNREGISSSIKELKTLRNEKNHIIIRDFSSPDLQREYADTAGW